MSYHLTDLIRTLSVATKANPEVVERLIRLDDSIVNSRGTVKVEDWIQGAKGAVDIRTIQLVYDAYLQFLIDHDLVDHDRVDHDRVVRGLTDQKVNK